jgi:hypothetical protein
MQKQDLLKYHVQLFGSDGHLTPAIRALFEVTEAEATMLNLTVDAAKQRRGEIEVGLARTYADPGTGNFIIDVPSYSDQGRQIYDEMVKQFRAVLGVERNKLLEEVCAAELDGAYAFIGMSPRRFEITHRLDDRGKELFHLSESFDDISASEDGRTVFTSTGGHSQLFPTRAKLIEHLGLLGAKYVPAEF